MLFYSRRVVSRRVLFAYRPVLAARCGDNKAGVGACRLTYVAADERGQVVRLDDEIRIARS